MERAAKQVIVMRTDLNMRKGKMCAQASHASVGAVWLIEKELQTLKYDDDGFKPAPWFKPYLAWKGGTFTKICVGVGSEFELLLIQHAAEEFGLPVKLIIDNVLTEFNGVPTKTCLAIGPAWAEDIDKITGHLRLL